MNWITREYAKVDRIACPWLIKNFIDPDAVFYFVPADEVLSKADELDATPFDVEGSELTHFKEQDVEHVSFDAFIKKYGIEDLAIHELARIVRGADAKIASPPAESAGLFAAATGFREIAKDDFDNMRLQFPLYDALYAFCSSKIKKNADV